jgi:hypothetical protein
VDYCLIAIAPCHCNVNAELTRCIVIADFTISWKAAYLIIYSNMLHYSSGIQHHISDKLMMCRPGSQKM